MRGSSGRNIQDKITSQTTQQLPLLKSEEES